MAFKEINSKYAVGSEAREETLDEIFSEDELDFLEENQINVLDAPPPPPAIELSEEQQSAIDYIVKQMKSNSAVVALAGPAGSGKTTAIKVLRERLSAYGTVIVAAMTNKAALVLNQKGIDAVTVHQACMRPVFKPPLDALQKYLEACHGAILMAQSFDDDSPNRDPVFPAAPYALRDHYSSEVLSEAVKATEKYGICAALRGMGFKDIFKHIDRWDAKEYQPGMIVIADESSMMTCENFSNLKQVFDRVILVGDECQLPPVEPNKRDDDQPVFWSIENRVALTQIHRQAEGSQPLQIATSLRNGQGAVPEPVEWIDVQKCKAGVPIIVWRNDTRIKTTLWIRETLGYSKVPQVGEFLICRNGMDKGAKSRGLINNTIWKIVEAEGFKVTLENDDGTVLKNERIYIEELDDGRGIPFRFAYVLTAHNAQGSEWPEVMIHVDEAMDFFDRHRADATKWLYTAVTRAKSRVIWVNTQKRKF